MKRTPLFRSISYSLLAGGMALSLSATAAEGLYSADELMDADVYNANGEEIGEVEDILMGDNMAVHSLVIKTGDVLGLGGRDVVVERGSFTVKQESTGSEFDDIDYEVHMDIDEDSAADLPEYDESWWNQTRESLAQAWENTKDTSESAWENTKEASSSAWNELKQGAEEIGDETEEAADDATN